MVGGGEGSRTLIARVQTGCSPVELHPLSGHRNRTCIRVVMSHVEAPRLATRAEYLVETAGIEPTTAQCRRAVIPFHHVPVVQAPGVEPDPLGFQPSVRTGYTRPADVGCPGRIRTSAD